MLRMARGLAPGPCESLIDRAGKCGRLGDQRADSLGFKQPPPSTLFPFCIIKKSNRPPQRLFVTDGHLCHHILCLFSSRWLPERVVGANATLSRQPTIPQLCYCTPMRGTPQRRRLHGPQAGRDRPSTTGMDARTRAIQSRNIRGLGSEALRRGVVRETIDNAAGQEHIRFQ